MSEIFIGIDPGLEGAIAVVGPGQEARFLDTPFVFSEINGKRRRVYDEAQMANLLRGVVEGVEMIAIESVHAFPGQGVTSMFTFGMGYGIWLGIIAALGVRSVRVEPRRWKKEVMADGPKTDQAVVAIAGRLYPSASGALRTVRGKLLLGRADALLIAHWAKNSGRA